MHIHMTKRYQRHFAKLPPVAQQAIQRALRYFDQPVRTQPLLCFDGIYELRAANWRVTWSRGESPDQVLLRNCGSHDLVLKRP